MGMRTTKIYCYDCEMIFERKMGNSSLVHTAKDNKIMDKDVVIKCVYCGGNHLTLNEYKNKPKKT